MNAYTPPPPSGVPGLTPTQVRARAIELGWPVIPIVAHDAAHTAAGKAPSIRHWQHRAQYEGPATTLADLAEWEATERKAPGTGIPCGPVVAFDADFATDEQLADQVRNVIIDVCGPTPFERQGAHPKFALIYRAAEAMPSISLKAADGSGDGFDILAEGRQIVAFGTHRKTLRSYTWPGTETPLTAAPNEAPEVTQAQVDEVIRRVRLIVELSSTGGRAGRRGGEGAKVVRDAAGIVIDGREIHLTRTVYSVARTMRAEGLELDQETLARRAWERFADTAKTDDGHWGRVDAEIKAKALIAKWRSGRLDLDSDEVDDERVDPTYPDLRQSVLDAECATRGTIRDFFEQHVPDWCATLAAWKKAAKEAKIAKEAWQERRNARTRAGLDFSEDNDPEPEAPPQPLPLSWGARVETAIGKTREAVRAAAAAAKAGLVVIYAGPMHALLGEIADAFLVESANVRIYRGYSAADPEQPGMAMCHDLVAVEDAQNAAARSIRESVCERKVDGKKLLCAFHDRCGMQRQREAMATVWLVPHALLFQMKPEFIPNPDAIVIDENITMGALPDKPVRMTLDAIETADCEIPDEKNAFNMATNDLEVARGNLARALRAHPKDGPLQRSILLRNHVTAALAGSAVRLEWMRLKDPDIQPGMQPKARRALVSIVGQHNRELKQFSGLWHELRAFLSGEAEASGRLTLRYDEEAECRVLERRSLDTIVSSWAAPCLCLDATLPEPALITPVLGHAVEMKADITAYWSPHGKVRQLVGAPISATKLGIVEGREPETPRRSVTDLLRLIRLRAALVDQDRTIVVIAPMRLVAKFKELGLPENVECGHFGAIAGIDRWNAAAGLIVIGQMQPGPRIVEALAGIITGTVPETLPEPTIKGPGVWFPRVDGGIRLANGEGVRVQHCQHPDPVVEALRWQITEAGLIQAIGRLRALRRGPDSPFFLDIVNDMPLPLSVDVVENWDSAKPGAWAGMVPEGILLESAGDVEACFPEIAPTRQAAREVALPTVVVTPIRELLIGVTTTLRRARYKRLGRYRPAAALLLPNAPSDLKSWLTDRLGAIEWLEIEEVEAPNRGSTEPPSPAAANTPAEPFNPPRAADYDPGLAAAYRCVVDRPADPTRPAPVKAEIVTFDPTAGIRFPPVIAEKLARLRAADEAANAKRSTATRDGRRRPRLMEATA